MVTVTINAIFWLKVVSIAISSLIVGYFAFEHGYKKGSDEMAHVIDDLVDGIPELLTRKKENESIHDDGKDKKIKELEEENSFLRSMVEQLKEECNSKNRG